MKTRKTSKRKTTRRKSTARRYGTELPLGSKRRTRRKSTRRYSGFKAGKIDIVKPLINSGVAVAGGIAGSFIANKIPVQDARIKAALPLALGLVLDITKFGRKNAMVQAAAAGMMVVGGLALVRQLFPTVPLLAGEEEVSMIDTSDIDPTLLGAPVDLMGEELELSADADDYVSAADL